MAQLMAEQARRHDAPLPQSSVHVALAGQATSQVESASQVAVSIPVDASNQHLACSAHVWEHAPMVEQSEWQVVCGAHVASHVAIAWQTSAQGAFVSRQLCAQTCPGSPSQRVSGWMLSHLPSTSVPSSAPASVRGSAAESLPSPPVRAPLTPRPASLAPIPIARCRAPSPADAGRFHSQSGRSRRSRKPG